MRKADTPVNARHRRCKEAENEHGGR